ncbi:hypothetical protein HDU97_004747 [Phlyctochytrium planicorne]|nr:hypothetical protein HDU97_004747 [Phlyctochytrium planicorne]
MTIFESDVGDCPPSSYKMGFESSSTPSSPSTLLNVYGSVACAAEGDIGSVNDWDSCSNPPASPISYRPRLSLETITEEREED